jgi:hypothetical protein
VFRKYFLFMAIFFAVFSFLSAGQLFAEDKCVSHMTDQYWVIETEQYTACNSEMRTTFHWHASPTNGYYHVYCKVYGTSFDHMYSIGEMPAGTSGNIVEWTHCTNMQNHSLVMDVEPYIDPEPHRGFIDGTTFTADYFAPQQE